MMAGFIDEVTYVVKVGRSLQKLSMRRRKLMQGLHSGEQHGGELRDLAHMRGRHAVALSKRVDHAALVGVQASRIVAYFAVSQISDNAFSKSSTGIVETRKFELFHDFLQDSNSRDDNLRAFGSDPDHVLPACKILRGDFAKQFADLREC